MKYSISYKNPLSHVIDISLDVDNIKEDIVCLQLPAWRPGRYEVANFAKNILQVEAFDYEGNGLVVKKTTKDSWLVKTGGSGSIRVMYRYYAYQMDAGSSWVDGEQLYINFINCMLYVDGRMGSPCIVNLDLPIDYRIACGLIEKEGHSLLANSYFQLVDSPMMASNALSHYEYMVRGVCFNIWIQGVHGIDAVKMLSDFEQFTKAQIDVMGDFPCDSYHFLIQALPYRYYHGVEHQNSTVITLGPANELNHSSLYRALLGIGSHELFHTWNVIKIRPQEMLPYDFSKENYFDTGYVAEGFTTYYGDLFLVRCGVLGIDWYFSKINRVLKSHFENFGRANMSVAESSFDLWLDGYVSGAPNRKVSIYNEGAIIALMLDLQIRIKSNHTKGLDDVMRSLWDVYGKMDLGYSSDSVLELLNGCIAHDWRYFFDHYIYGTTPIEGLLSSLLEHFGCKMDLVSAIDKNESMWGFRVDNDDLIVKIQPFSIAESYLSIGDRVKNLKGALANNDGRLDVERNHKMVRIQLPLGGDGHYFEYYQISRMQDITGSQEGAFRKWLEGDGGLSRLG